MRELNHSQSRRLEDLLQEIATSGADMVVLDDSMGYLVEPFTNDEEDPYNQRFSSPLQTPFIRYGNAACCTVTLNVAQNTLIVHEYDLQRSFDWVSNPFGPQKHLGNDIITSTIYEVRVDIDLPTFWYNELVKMIEAYKRKRLIVTRLIAGSR